MSRVLSLHPYNSKQSLTEAKKKMQTMTYPHRQTQVYLNKFPHSLNGLPGALRWDHPFPNIAAHSG